MDGRRAELAAGGYSGPVICDAERASFRLAGTAHAGGRSYRVYDYRYRFSFEGGTVLYPGQRVLLLDARGAYLGQYALTLPPLREVGVRGASITIGGGDAGLIDLTQGPPVTAMVNGESVRFFK